MTRGRAPLGIRVVLLATVLGLTVVGILFVHSTTAADGEPFPSAGARRQIVKAVIACLGLLVVARLDYRLFDRGAHVIYLGLLVVLAAMLGVRLAAGGLNRFIELYVFQVQPSELMKIGLVLGLARYLRYRDDQASLRGLLMPFLLTVGPMALVLLQPDLGTSLMFPPVLLAMLLVAGARRTHLATALVVGVLIVPAAYLLGDYLPLFREYQRDRITAFVKRDEVTRRNQGFQLRQSEIAIGSGGLLGKGYRSGTQNRLDFVPEKETDFIFSIIAEELGFVGAALVVAGQLVVVLSIFAVAARTREPFGCLVASGLGTAFGAQSIQNLGMTLGLTPITGVPLPFVSLGGSSLVTSYVAVGIVLSIASHPVRVVATRDLAPRDRRRAILVRDDRPAGRLEGI